ncbi:MAG TPA: hypothetical protein VFE37_15230, partial [Chloroflexota bacterium]|nr:hypothetical protein [Chloroflexota bacterium]
MRRLLPLLVGGALLSLGPTAAAAQNLCSPSTATTTRYPAYPGSTPYSGNTIQVTSNCTGPAVDPGIRPDPFADPDSLPAPSGSVGSAVPAPSADPATLYAPTTPAGAPGPGAMAAPPGQAAPNPGLPAAAGVAPGQGPAGTYPGAGATAGTPPAPG